MKPFDLRTPLGNEPLNYVIVDLSNMIFKGFFAFKHMETSDGVKFGHYFYMGQLINALVSSIENPCVILCKDNYDNKKTEIFSDYKGNRPKKDFSLEEVSTRIIEALSVIPGVYGAETANEEADSVMYSLSKTLPANKYILSTDNDMLQAMSLTCKIVNRIRDGVPDVRGVSYCMKKFGVHPSKLLMYRSIKGDISDNLNGYHRFPQRVAVHISKKYSNPMHFLMARVPETNDKTLLKYWRMIRKEPRILKRNYQIMKLSNVDVMITEKGNLTTLAELVNEYNLRTYRGLYDRFAKD